MMKHEFVRFFSHTICVSFWFILFFGSTTTVAYEIDYAHAIITTSAGNEITVEVADTVEKRSLGLGNRPGLKKGWGMLFVFGKRKQHRFWMKRMQFPLDIIWLDNHRIVHILRNAQPAIPGEKPQIMSPPLPANFVLEIDAGRASELKLQLGQSLQYQFLY